MIPDIIEEIQNDIKELNEKINFIAKYLGINLDFELRAEKRKKKTIRAIIEHMPRAEIRKERLEDRFE